MAVAHWDVSEPVLRHLFQEAAVTQLWRDWAGQNSHSSNPAIPCAEWHRWIIQIFHPNFYFFLITIIFLNPLGCNSLDWHFLWHWALGWQALPGSSGRWMMNTSRQGHPGNLCCPLEITRLLTSCITSQRWSCLQPNVLSPFLFIIPFILFLKAPHFSNKLERCLGMPNNKMHFRSGFIINVCIVYLSWKDYSD